MLLTFALVFAAAFGGMSAETQAASRIRLNRNTLTMTKGERFRLRVRNLSNLEVFQPQASYRIAKWRSAGQKGRNRHHTKPGTF